MAQAEEQIGRGGLLPLAVQNAYRERYRAIRPGWRSSGDQLETLVRGHVTSTSRVLDLGCGRGGLVEEIWRDVKLAAGLDPDGPSLSGHRAVGMPVIRGGGRKPAVYRPVLRPHRVPVGAGAFEKPGGNAARGTSRTRTAWTLRFSYAQHAQPADGRKPVREGAPVAAAQARAYVLRPRGSRHVSGAVPRQHS